MSRFRVLFPLLVVAAFVSACGSDEPSAEVPAVEVSGEPEVAQFSYGDVPAGFEAADVPAPQEVPSAAQGEVVAWSAGPFRLVQSEDDWSRVWPQISGGAAPAPAVDFAQNAVIVVRQRPGSEVVKPWIVRNDSGEIRVMLDAESIEMAGAAEGDFYYYVLPLENGYVASIDFN